MKTNLFHFIIILGLPALLHAGAPVTKVADLLKPQVIFSDYTVEAPSSLHYSVSSDGKLQVSGDLKEKTATLVLRPKEGTWDISAYAFFRVDLTNRSDGLIWVRGAINAKGGSASMAFILPGERATVGFPFPRMLESDDSPEHFKLQDIRPNGFRYFHWMPFHPEQMSACRLTIFSTSDHLSLEDIQLSVGQPYGVAANPGLHELPYLDKFGQVRQLDWPNKLHSDEELATRAAQEIRDTQTDKGPASFNRFGGWNSGPQLEATGFFRVEKYKGRWWFVDPDGRLFFSHGANSIGFEQSTPILHNGKSRADLFAWTPSETDIPDAISKFSYHFMKANLYRKFGPDWQVLAHERIHSRLRRLGMNTIGAWSDKELYANPKTPYTNIIHVWSGSKPLGKKVADPFAPEFEKRVEEGLRKLFPNGEDPWCVGVFIDNEIGWYEKFVQNTLLGTEDMPARKVMMAWLQQKYPTITQLNAAWGTAYESWEALTMLPEKSDEFDKDVSELKRLVAHQYYKVCHAMMRKVLPRQLYLGSRIHSATPEIMEEAARFVDVLSVNRYMPLAVTKLPEGFDKPCLIAEFHFGAPDRGVPGTGLSYVGDQMARSRAYASYVLDAVLQPNIVGTHWFAYTDQSAAGRWSAGRNGENYQVGFVDVTDTLYPEISATSRSVAEMMYSLADKGTANHLEVLEATLRAVPQATSQQTAEQTAFRPGRPWLDTNGVHINAHGFSILDVNGRYYWYGSEKIEGKTEDEKNEAGVRLYVSNDLVNWQDKGRVLDVFAPDAHPDLAEAFILDRPKVIFNEATKKYILYFKLYPPKEKGGKSGKDYAWVGVATSSTPTGPFDYKGYFLGNHSEFGTGDFAIFADTDGAIYHIAVRKPDKALVYGRLSEDGLKPVGDYKVFEGVTLKTEAPAFFRRGGKVYLLGSGTSGWKPNPARMFVADRFTGPYTELPNPCVGVNPLNNMGPDKTFGGQSTFVYQVSGRKDAWIAMFDINKPEDPINAGYIWLPVEFEADRPVIRWRDEWDLSVFQNSP